LREPARQSRHRLTHHRQIFLSAHYATSRSPKQGVRNWIEQFLQTELLAVEVEIESLSLHQLFMTSLLARSLIEYIFEPLRQLKENYSDVPERLTKR
jgi:hypothetical protein